MKAFHFFAAMAFFASAGQAFAYDEGTHHLCSGLYAHQENDGTWRLFRSRAGEIVEEGTAPASATKAQLLAEHCGSDDHPEVHD